MPYALKYVTQFDSDPDSFNPSVRYTLQFLFKDYAGPVISIEGGSTTVLQKCTTEDPLAPIKGQSLDMLLINPGNLPITSFYADNDKDIQVILLNELLIPLFIGFLIQDDCHEIMVDDAHEIQLSANDGLGLLKDVPLDTDIANISLVQGYSAANIESTAPHQIEVSICYFTPIIGIPFIITSHASLNGTYTLTNVQTLAANHYRLTVVETVGSHAVSVGIAESVGPVNLNGNVSLLTLINLCLYNTGIRAVTNILCNIKEQRQTDIKSHFEQTLLNAGMFITSEVYEDCYNVLTKILETFDCQLQQANGQWNIVHWFEIRKYLNNAIPGYVYDEDMRLTGTTALNNNFFIGPDIDSPQPTVPVIGLMQSILRPYKFVRRQFNYNIPKYFLANYDLQQVGSLIRTYIGPDGVKNDEYNLVGWVLFKTTYGFETYIRVRTDAAGREVERFLVIQNPTVSPTAPPRAVISNAMIFHKGDSLTFSFSTRGINFFLVTGTIEFVVEVDNGSTTMAVTINKTFQPPPNFYNFPIPTTPNLQQWTDVTIEGINIPFDGIGRVYLNHYASLNSAQQTHYKDMRMEYVTRVNDSRKIIGHIHKQNRINDIKNNSDTEVFLDDAPRVPIGGALMLQAFTNNIPDLTANWQYNAIPGIYYKRGQLTTLEEIIYRDKMRSKFEGSFIGLHQSNIISLLAVMITDFYPTKNYIFGLLTIDYKRNQFSGTLWEIWDTAEPDVIADYTFNYIYDTK